MSGKRTKALRRAFLATGQVAKQLRMISGPNGTIVGNNWRKFKRSQ